MYAVVLVKQKMYKDAIEKLDNAIQIDENFYGAKFVKAEALLGLNKPQEAIGVLTSLPDWLYDSKDFLNLCSISYTNLAQLSPSNYNIETAKYYCNKLKELYPGETVYEKAQEYIQETLKTNERH